MLSVPAVLPALGLVVVAVVEAVVVAVVVSLSLLVVLVPLAWAVPGLLPLSLLSASELPLVSVLVSVDMAGPGVLSNMETHGLEQ